MGSRAMNEKEKPKFKDRMDEDIMRVTRSLLNLLKRRYPDNWREKLAEFVR
jgi:hypothetical protein